MHIFRENCKLHGSFYNVLNGVLIDNAFLRYQGGWKLQEDYSIHKSKFSRAYQKFREISCIDWPANNPDLNPTANLWSYLNIGFKSGLPKR